jgi:glucosamine-6-phosphate deaminase
MAVRFLPVWPLPASWRVMVFDDRREADEQLVAEFLARVRGRPRPRVVLASGATFAGLFGDLRRRLDDRRADLSDVRFTHLDELTGVSPREAGSLGEEIRRALFPDHDPRRGSFEALDPAAPDAARRHEEAVRGADLCFVGVGANGHLAFNEPGASFASTTRVAELAAETRGRLRDAFHGREVPRTALTAGVATILGAREIVAAAFGASKAEAVEGLLVGPLDPRLPASALRLHDRVTLILDREAASRVADGVRIEAARPLEGPRVMTRAELSPADRLLVIAPHPDDAAISAGGLLASAPRSAARRIATFSTGARADGPWKSSREAVAAREAEAAAEAADLGADVRFLRAKGYESGALESADVEALRAELREFRPTRVFAPARLDPHPTHRLCRLAVEEALRREIVEGLGGIELWTVEGPWSRLAREEIDVLFTVDAAAHEIKRRAIGRHASQTARVPFERGADALEILRAIEFSESHFGGRKVGGFDPSRRVEAFGVEALALRRGS